MRSPIRQVAPLAAAILLVLTLVCCASPPPANAPHQPAALTPQARSETFTRAELEDDFDACSNVLLTRNPLQFADRAGLDAFIKLQREKLRDGMSELDLYRILTPIVVKVRCGHSGIFLSSAAEARLRARQPYLPILVRILDGHLFVLSPLQAAAPPAMSEITAINGRPAADTIRSLMDYVTADGENVSRKLYVAGRLFNDLYALFIDQSPEFRVEYRAPDGSAGAFDLRGISKAELERQASSAGFPYGLPEGPQRNSFSNDQAAAAVLTVRTFQFLTGRPDFEKFFDQAFDAMQETGAKALILDLRGNWGGDPEAASYLFARLIREPEPYFAEGTPLYGPLTRALPPAQNAFSGRLIVLTDGACFSSTGHLCSLLRFHGLGTFLGEETGGSWATTDSSADYPLRRTGMRLRSSNAVYRTAVSGLPPGRGIVPDEEVEPGIEDLIAGRDPVMERALSLAAAAAL
jgi:hypothetical protein